MLKFTSPTPTNSEIAKSVNKTEGSIRAHKKQHPEEIENINLKLKEVVKRSKCTCCFECDQIISSKISLP